MTADGASDGTSVRWWILAVAVFGFMQVHLHRMAFAPLIPRFVDDLALSYAAAGTIQTAYFWSYAAAQIPIGIVADRWGARRVMLACMALLAAGAVAFAASTSYGGAILARLAVGLGAAAVWVPGMRLISERFGPMERGRATGLMSGGGGLGGTLGVVVVPWLAAAVGWRLAYASLAAPALLAFVAIAALVPRAGTAPAAGGPAAGTLRRVLGTRDLWPLNLAVLFSYGGYFSWVTFLPAYLVQRRGMPETTAGIVTSLILAGTIVSWPLAGALSDRMGRRKPMFLVSQTAGVLACVACAVVLPHVGPLGAAAVTLAAGVLIGGMILPFVVIVEMFPPSMAATAAAVTNCATFAGGMLFPVVLGRVIDVTGSFPAAFLVAGAVQALALVCALFVAETGGGRYTPPR